MPGTNSAINNTPTTTNTYPAGSCMLGVFETTRPTTAARASVLSVKSSWLVDLLPPCFCFVFRVCLLLLQVEAAYQLVRSDWEAEAGGYLSVVTAGVEASSTDNEHQTIGKE